MALRIMKKDSQILKELKANQNKLTNLDVGFLMGKVPEKEYHEKRNSLKHEVIKIINREKLRTRLNGNWSNLV
jgi:ABC-type Fe2+-enterobactin transport system substrate-binding protein